MWLSSMADKLEQEKSLDPAVEAITSAVDKVLPPGRVKDALHGLWLGHSLHPLLVAMPIGMFTSASFFDLLGGDDTHAAAKRLIGAGVLIVAPTAASGLADWSALGYASRPQRVGLVHASANVLATALYGASWLARSHGNHARGRNLALVGSASLALGGYLGGHLSYKLGVGVSRNMDEETAPAEWTDAAAADDVAEGTMHRVQVEGQEVLLARSGGKVMAMGAVCSHYGGPLEEGQLSSTGEPCVTCPWHGSVFCLTDGSVIAGPASVPQLSYDVRTVGDRLEIRVAT